MINEDMREYLATHEWCKIVFMAIVQGVVIGVALAIAH